jgi:lysophospholipase L1-like esterase
LTNAVLALGSLLVSLLLGEVALRAVVQLTARRVLPEVRYAPHPVRRFTLLPDQQVFSYGAPARIDERGFRANGPASAPRGDAPAILALGDSFTFGLGVRDEETWPARLETLVSAMLRQPIDVINAGTISYGVFQEMDLLKTAGLAERPRVVVHALYWNDFMNAAAPPPGARPVVDENGYFTWDQLSSPPGAARRLLSTATSSSALAYTLRQAAGAVVGSAGATAGYGAEYTRFIESGLTPEDWRPVELFYEELKRLGEERGFAPFAVIMPVRDLVLRGEPRTHPYPRAARDMLGRLGIPFLDAFELWAGRRGDEDFLPEGADAHLNAAGYARLAEATARRLLADERINRILSENSRAAATAFE